MAALLCLAILTTLAIASPAAQAGATFITYTPQETPVALDFSPMVPCGSVLKMTMFYRFSGKDIYVAGFTTSPATARDILTLKHGGGGQSRWARSHGGIDMSNDFAAGLLAVSGGVYTAGKRGAGTGNDGILLKYRP